jgi:5'-nucleotidase
MPYDLSQLFVVGISSRALFDLEAEDRIFRSAGLQAFIDYQRSHEEEVLRRGSAFWLVKGLLDLNRRFDPPKVEVILLSRNHPDVSLRVFNSIEHYGLQISRAALTGGAPLGPYFAPFKVGLFLSQSLEDVQSAANQGFAAGLIYSAPPDMESAQSQIRIAFDGDCVLFSDEAQRIYDREGTEAFYKHEKENARKELPAGPFAKSFLRFLSEIQGPDPEESPVRIALVTDRNSPAHKRALYTLRAWNVRLDEAFFLGGIPKAGIVSKFGAHMFFDDKEEYCKLAAERVPTSRVFLPGQKEAEIEVSVRLETMDDTYGEKRFLLICKTHLQREFASSEAELKARFQQLKDWPEESLTPFLEELEESVKGTPIGAQRRAVGDHDTATVKLRSFLDRLAAKYNSKIKPS